MTNSQSKGSGQASSLGQLFRGKSRSRRDSLRAQSAATAFSSPIRNDLLPRLRFEDRMIGELKPPKRNVRLPDPAHVQDVVGSLRTFGVCRPVVVDGDGVVVDGWVVVEAARQLGLPSVPCVVVDHLTAAERRTLRIALNRLGEKGMWDLSELKIEFEELRLENAPLEVTGFSAIEIDQIVLDEVPALAETGPLAPDPGLEPIAQPGDLWQLGPHRVLCDDARHADGLECLLAGRTAQLVLTDPPYNVPIRGHVTGGAHREFRMASGEMSAADFEAFNADWIKAVAEHLVDGGLVAPFIDWRGYSAVHVAALRSGLEQLNLVVWAKTNAGMGSLYRSGHELLPFYKKGKAAHRNNVELGRHGRWRPNVWTYPGASSLGSDARKGLKDHPTVKPTAMLEDALLDVTARGDVVLDPFLGSGSTLIAAEKTGRVCCGVEIDPLYVDVILRRWKAVTGQDAECIERREAAPQDEQE